MESSDDITVHQAEVLLKAIEPAALYVEKLQRRLQALGVPCTDPYYMRVAAAATEMHTLRIWTFYMTCAEGVGNSDRDKE
jgi:hypothetical protein